MEESKTERQRQEEEEEKDLYGILLYYRYTCSIPDLDSLLSFYRHNCNSLSILGRVRLSSNGVNVTIGGKLSCLEKHIVALKSLHPCFQQGTDFKLASCNFPPFNDHLVARECGFTSLSIRIVKELVTFSSSPLLNPPDISNAGTHLSASEFHSLLHSATASDKHNLCDSSKDIVLLDARNLYETRIGKFETPNVETLDPHIRQYSDLPSWIDDHSEQLRGRNVLMYCTGGIRCEMASAYIKSKGTGFQNVFQVSYLVEYRGIWNNSLMVAISKGRTLFLITEYPLEARPPIFWALASCVDRHLMTIHLVADAFFAECSSWCVVDVRYAHPLYHNKQEEAVYVCELCQKHGKSVDSKLKLLAIENEKCDIDSSDACHADTGPSRKLRILCLHGFRQNASGFRGRTASLAKKLKRTAELVFVDAPHELPYVYCPVRGEEHTVENSYELQQIPPPDNCRRKFAWFLGPDTKGSSEIGWKMADAPFDPLQYQQQTQGFEISLEHLKDVFAREGPFDGILGFSQGAAMAASICSLEPKLREGIKFRFAIFCSGFAAELSKKIEPGSIKCPSLHIFGSVVGKDRQIDNVASRDLASLFEDGCSVVIEHDCGHIIPTRHPYIDDIKSFLLRFS
ncbi:Rhodanese-like domain-containing protein 6 [Linum perenne]